MFRNVVPRSTTDWLSSIQIWGSSLLAIVGGIAGLIEGRGMALSLLIAVGILPLAFVTILIIKDHQKIRTAVTSLLTSADSLPGSHKSYMYDPADEAPDQNAYYDLMDFVIQYLLPACEAQIELQRQIIKTLSDNYKITELAIWGLEHAPLPSTVEFWKNYYAIVRGIDSSEPTIRFSAMVEHIRGLERGSYNDFCYEADNLGASSNLDFRIHEETANAWETWRERHNALVNKYDDIKKQVRFGRLFYPRKQSRWGYSIPAIDNSVPRPKQLR